MSHNIRFVEKRTRKRLIKKFTDKIGLVYFGSVDQYSDEHKVVRGFTVSESHQDNHYSVGASGEYDITLVDRRDAVWQANGTALMQNWLIMAFDLHTKKDLPHFFIGAKDSDTSPYFSFFQTFPAITEVQLGAFENYSSEFTDRYVMYSRQSMAVKMQRLLPASTSALLGSQAWPLSFEQNEHVLYVYSCKVNVTDNLLNSMYQNGLWLAGQIDYIAELI